MEEQNIKALIKDKTPLQAQELLAALIEKEPENPWLHIERGKQLWRLGRRGEAMSEYATADKLQPNGAAALLIEHSNDVMDFFNPDLLNP